MYQMRTVRRLATGVVLHGLPQCSIRHTSTAANDGRLVGIVFRIPAEIVYEPVHDRLFRSTIATM